MTRKATPDLMGGIDIMDDILSAGTAKPREVSWNGRPLDYPIDRIQVGKRLRPLGDVTTLAQSMQEIGILNPINILPDGTLVAGYHRLEAAKRLGWETIRAIVVEMDEVDAELAEIDENLRRSNLTVLEEAEHLLRREELLEAKGLRAKSGAQPGNINNVPDAIVEGRMVRPSTMTTSDIAQSMGMSDATTQRRLQIAKNLDSDAKAAIRNNEEIANSTTQLLELARQPAERQRTIADMLISGKAANVHEAVRLLTPPPPPVAPMPPPMTVSEVLPAWAREEQTAQPSSGKLLVDWTEEDWDIYGRSSEAIAAESAARVPDHVLFDAILTPTKPHVAHNSRDNEWYTPVEYIDAARRVMERIDLDPASCEEANRVVKAAKYFSEEDDGLTQPWRGRVWMNPPYASTLIGSFCERFADQTRKGHISQGIVLVNNATETEWFATLVDVASAVVFPRSRVRFWKPDGTKGAPLQGQAILYMGPHPALFLDHFSEFGWGAML